MDSTQPSKCIRHAEFWVRIRTEYKTSNIKLPPQETETGLRTVAPSCMKALLVPKQCQPHPPSFVLAPFQHCPTTCQQHTPSAHPVWFWWWWSPGAACHQNDQPAADHCHGSPSTLHTPRTLAASVADSWRRAWSCGTQSEIKSWNVSQQLHMYCL